MRAVVASKSAQAPRAGCMAAVMAGIARDSGWLAFVPEVVVQDELQSGRLVVVGVSDELREHFYAITTPQRYRPPVLDLLMAGGH